MKSPPRTQHAFTLIEMLVVIAIIALLVSLLVPVIGRVNRAAQITQGLAGIRQSGTFLLMEGTEHEGKLGLHIWGSSSGMWDYRLVNIVGDHLGVSHHSDPALSKIIRTPAWYDPPFGSLSTWTVWGVNYEDNPDNGVYWKAEEVPGYPQKVHFLRMFQVENPAVYALLGDSSNAEGQPHLRLSRFNSGGIGFAMRYNRKGLIFTLDGAAKTIGEADMETYGFRIGYLFDPSNPATDPTRVRAY